MRPIDYIKALGPGHLLLIEDPDGSLRLEPTGYSIFTYLISFAWLLLFACLWFTPDIPLEFRAWASCISALVATGLIAYLRWLDFEEEKLGPYLMMNRKECRLRNNVRIPVAEVYQFAVANDLADDEQSENRKTPWNFCIECHSGEMVRVLANISFAEILRLTSRFDAATEKLMRQSR